MPEEKKTSKVETPKPAAAKIQEEETLAERVERVHAAKRKDRAAMVAGRAKRTRVGGSWTVGKDGKLDANGNDRKKGIPKK